MSLIQNDNLNYLTTVEQFFLSLKNSGLSLSANDYHLISEWEERGIPVKTVCRGIEKGFDRLEGQNRRPFEKVSLTYFKDIIEEEISSGGGGR